MSLVTNTYNGADGVFLTAATSGGTSGDAYQIVNPSNTAAVAYFAGTTNPITELTSVGKFDAGLNTATSVAEVRFVRTGAIRGAQQAIVQFNGAPSSTCVLIQSRGNLQNGDLRVTSTGIFHMQLADGATLGLTGGVAVDLSSTSPWYVIDYWIEEGTTTATGRAKFRVRSMNDLTTVLHSADSGSTRNTGVQGTNTITDWRIGKFTQAATLPAIYIAQHAANDGALDYLADPVASIPAGPPPVVIGTVYRHNFDGWTEGQAITTGGSGSGTPLTDAPTSGAATIVANASAAVHGSRGATLTVPTNALAGVGWGTLDTPQLATSGILKFTSWPSSANQRIVNTYRVSSGSTSPHLDLNTDGTLTMRDAAHNVVYTSPSPIPLNVPLEVQLYVLIGTTTTNGTIQVKVTRRDTDVVFWDPGLLATVNASTSNFNGVRYGLPSVAVWDAVVAIDDVAYSIDTGGIIAAYDGTAGNAGVDQLNLEPWQTVTLSATGVGSWTQVSGAAVTLSGSGATRTFVAPPSLNTQTLVFAYGGDSVTITILPATEAVYSGGQWVPVRLMR